MDYKEEYMKFINDFISKNSPYKVNEFVIIKSFGPSKRPYQITKILVGDDGEIFYTVTSPRSHSTLPSRFKINDLERFEQMEFN
jgi:hypothetical protein